MGFYIDCLNLTHSLRAWSEPRRCQTPSPSAYALNLVNYCRITSETVKGLGGNIASTLSFYAQEVGCLL